MKSVQAKDGSGVGNLVHGFPTGPKRMELGADTLLMGTGGADDFLMATWLQYTHEIQIKSIIRPLRASLNDQQSRTCQHPS